MTTTPELQISVPPQWRRRSDPDRGVLVRARAPTIRPSGYQPELTVRFTLVDDGLHRWRDGALADLGGRLVDLQVEEVDAYELGGIVVDYRRFAHRSGPVDVLCDQWAWLFEGPPNSPAGALGVTLTCAAAREDYPDYCDVFEAVAGTVEVVPRAA